MAKKSEAKIKFTAETSDLNKGLSESSKSIRLLTNELKLNATQLKGNSNDINLLKTRQDLLQKELEESRNKVNLTEQAMVKAKKILGENSTEYNKLANDVLKAKNQEAAIKNELDSVTSKLDQQDKAVEKVGDELDNTGSHAVTFGEAIKANVISDFIMSGLTALKNKVVDVAKGLKDAALNAGTFADDLITTSNQTGISTKELQQLEYAMRFIDVDMDTLTKSMAKNTKQMGAGNENYKKLGISVKDSSGNLRDSKEVFLEVVDALGKIENETERDSISMELFGKSAQELNPLIKAGGDELEKYCKQAEDLGLVVDDETVKALGSFDDSMQTADATMDAFKTKMGAAVAPAFQGLAEDASEFIQTADFSGIAETAEDFAGAISSATEFVVEHKDGLIALTAGLGAAAVAYGILNVAMPIYTALSTGAALSTTALGGAIAFLTSPITIAAVAIGALVAGGVALYKNWDTIKSKAKSFGSDVSGKISKMKTSVVKDFEGMKKEGVEKWEGLKSGAIEKATSLKTKLFQQFVA